MHRFKAVSEAAPSGQPRRWLQALLLAGLIASWGCAAITNPVGDGIRVRHLPEELLTPSKEGEQTIPLNLLRLPPPAAYQLAPGDVLGIYVEGFLGERTAPLPVNIGPPVLLRDQRRLPPSSGYPVPVQADGTINLPSIPPLVVKGLSVPEVREAIRKSYLKKELIQPENDRIFVTLLQGRLYSVLVLRQETGAFTAGPNGPIAAGKRGTGYVVDLPAYENDVLHALALSGGLPGLDACNEVIIQRGVFHNEQDREIMRKLLETTPASCNALKAIGPGGQTIRIPLRTPAGVPPPLRPEDITLQTGDVVFLEACDAQWFYTGGLLPPGKYLLPRDHDLDVVQAVAEVRGPLLNGSFGGSNLSGDLVKPGLGNPSATSVVVVRRLPDGSEVPIRVDLGRALHDPQERILVQANDVLILQEKPGEAFARYFSQTFLNFDIFWQVLRSKTATGVLDISGPDRLPNRLGTVEAFQP